jgi:hypothetical protein
MVDRVDWYFRQKVTEAELDGAFDDVEQGIWNLATDLSFFGIVAGLAVAEASVPNLTVDVTAGTAYDQDGARVRIPTLQNLDVSVDSNSVSTAVTTPGNSKIVSVFVKFDRALSDPRTDGNSNTVYFERDESFEFYVTQGAEAASPSPPALESDAVLIADVTIAYGDTQIFDAAINLTGRRQDAFATSTSTLSIREGTPLDAITAVLQELDDHITAVANLHPATAIDYAGGPAWADTTTNPATTVEAQLDKIVGDLASQAGNGGAYKIGHGTISGTPYAISPATTAFGANVQILGWLNATINGLADTTTSDSGARDIGCEAQASYFSLTAGTLFAQLGQVLSALDDIVAEQRRIFVDENAAAGGTNGSPTQPFDDIPSALAKATSGNIEAIIEITPGTYTDALTLSATAGKKLTLRGSGRELTEISGNVTIFMATGGGEPLRFEGIKFSGTISLSGTLNTDRTIEFVNCEIVNAINSTSFSGGVANLRIVVIGDSCTILDAQNRTPAFGGLGGGSDDIDIELVVRNMRITGAMDCYRAWLTHCEVENGANLTYPSGGYAYLTDVAWGVATIASVSGTPSLYVDAHSNWYVKNSGTVSGPNKIIRSDDTA